MRRIFVSILVTGLVLVIALLTVWQALALWYRLPLPETFRLVASGVFGLFGCVVVLGIFGRFWRLAVGGFAAVFAIVLFWWTGIHPPATGDWSPDVARQVTGRVDGNLLTLTNIRNFDWRSDTDFTEHWETRTYDLSELESLDIFMSYWAGPEMAHVILSFGFGSDTYLAWSVEVRRVKGGGFSPVADFFKTNTLVVIAAQERDVVGVRSNVRGEDVQLYRMNTSPDGARNLLLEYVRDANQLAITPTFYNSIFTNCTTVVVKMARAVGDTLPFDWRLIVNGYLPEYGYARQSLNTQVPLATLRDLGRIATRAQAVGLTGDYSRAIRVGVPGAGR